MPEDQATVSPEMSDVDAAEVLSELFKKLPDETAWLLREVELKERGCVWSRVSSGMRGVPMLGQIRMPKRFSSNYLMVAKRSLTRFVIFCGRRRASGCAEEMGVYNGGQPSRFNRSSGFSLFFDPQLNPGRFALHGGNARDSFDRLIITEDGPLLSGVSRSFHPWPGGSSGEDDFSSPAVQWLSKASVGRSP